MRLTDVIISIIFSLTCCQKHSLYSLTSPDKNKLFALQPIGQYNVEQLEVLKSQLNAFFNIRVITLEPLAIPEKFRSSYNEKYSADSLLLLLSKLKNDTIIEVIGITNKEIYTYQKTKFKQGNKSVYLNERIGIYGLGYLAGSSCIVSDYKFIKNDEALLNNLTRKAILHEIGHNLGLKHCSDETCVMAEADGDISNLIKLGHDYCKNCRKKLK